jgi:thiamine biosynthesis lipoprotein
MSSMSPDRRAFLTGEAWRTAAERVGDALLDRQGSPSLPLQRGPTLLLRTTAMATDFDVLLNPDGPDEQVALASAALDEVHRLEQRYSSYRDDSDLMQLNRVAPFGPVPLDEEMYGLLQRGRLIRAQTEQAFDHATGALIRLWRACRQQGRLPTDAELQEARTCSGGDRVIWDDAAQSVAFDRPGVELHLGAIGKGAAVDAAATLVQAGGVGHGLVHGGKSSVRAWGTHAGHPGWPIGLQNPMLPDRPLVTILLKDAALGTSGTAVQWFRAEGRRYGHILDPRTGWPAEGMLSVSVIAPDAALADALSTAFFVLGVEKALQACDNFPGVGALLFPWPADGRTVEPVVHHIPSEWLVWP